MNNTYKTYWASLPDSELLLELHRKIENYYEDLQNTKLFYVWERSFMAYFGAKLTGTNWSGQLFDSSELSRSGENSEIVNLKVNHYRNLLQHTLQLVTSDRPAWACRASNTDYKSQAQCVLGKGLLDYYYREKGFQRFYKQVVENSLVFGEGWVHAPWNETSGEYIGTDPDTGADLHEGDFEFSAHSPLDIVRDASIRNDEQHEWLIVRGFVNKFNLAAKYPAYSEKILNESYKLDTKYEQFDSFDLRIRRGSNLQSDRIPLWMFYHRPTEAMPSGRMCIFTNSCMTFSGPLPYEKIPVYPVYPENLIGTPYGYSPAFDLLAPQQAIDILTSTVMTNNAANGIQNIWTKKGDDLSVKDLGGGMKHLSSEEKPQAIQLTQSAPETFNFRQQLIGEMETLIGVSATVRGNPEASLKSGAALALIVSQSIQFASILEQSVNTMLEDFGTSLINNLKVFAKSNRIATIMGESSRPYQKEFSGDDLVNVSRVTVDRVSPISKTVAGRLQIADTLLEKGLIDNAKKYVMLLTTGSLDVVTEDIQNSMLNIQADMEALRRGEPVPVVMVENHADCINAAKNLINPDSKKDPQFVSLVLKYIQDHLDTWRNMPPDLAVMTGQQPPPPPSAPAVPAGGSPAAVTSTNPGPITPDQLPNEPNMPSLPPNAPEESQAAYEQLTGKL